MSTRNLWRAAFFASLAVLIFGISFQVSLARHWTRVPLPYGLNNPVLAMQMAKEPWPSAMLEPGDNREEMARQQYIDYGYIPSYVALFIFVAILQSHSTRQWISALGPLSVVVILIAATYDLAENRAILELDWPAIRPAAIAKWACAFLVILLQVPFYFTVAKPKILARIVGLAGLFAGTVGFYSAITGNEKGIGMATLPLLVAMLAMPLFFWLAFRAQTTTEPRA